MLKIHKVSGIYKKGVLKEIDDVIENLREVLRPLLSGKQTTIDTFKLKDVYSDKIIGRILERYGKLSTETERVLMRKYINDMFKGVLPSEKGVKISINPEFFSETKNELDELKKEFLQEIEKTLLPPKIAYLDFSKWEKKTRRRKIEMKLKNQGKLPHHIISELGKKVDSIKEKLECCTEIENYLKGLGNSDKEIIYLTKRLDNARKSLFSLNSPKEKYVKKLFYGLKKKGCNPKNKTIKELREISRKENITEDVVGNALREIEEKTNHEKKRERTKKHIDNLEKQIQERRCFYNAGEVVEGIKNSLSSKIGDYTNAINIWKAYS